MDGAASGNGLAPAPGRDDPREFVPFLARSSAASVRLATAATAFLVFVYILVSMVTRGLFEYLGADYRAFRSAAQVARNDGYAAVYDLGRLEPEQRRLVQSHASPAAQGEFAVIPVPYPPPFVALFQPLLLLPAIPGWIAWTVVNAAPLALYARRLVNGLRPSGGGLRHVSLFLSLPAILTLAFGQVNLLLCIAIGEFLLATRLGRDLRAGASLGLLLVKPQLAVLFFLWLLVARRWRALVGMSLAFGLVGLASLGLAGTEGLAAMGRLWMGYTADLATTYPDSMLNWRAAGLALRPVLGDSWAGVVALGSGVTLLATIRVWRRSSGRRSATGDTLATYAAATATAWHAHVHLDLPLVATIGAAPASVFRSEVAGQALLIAPTFAFALTGLTVGAGAAHRMAGLLFLVINLGIVAAAARSGSDRDAGE